MKATRRLMAKSVTAVISIIADTGRIAPGEMNNPLARWYFRRDPHAAIFSSSSSDANINRSLKSVLAPQHAGRIVEVVNAMQAQRVAAVHLGPHQ